MQSLLQYQCFSSQLLVCDSFRALTACHTACPRALPAARVPPPLRPAATGADGAPGSVSDRQPVAPLHA